jgi:Cu(I)/Ag(I) efflux system membrane fusion protein
MAEREVGPAARSSRRGRGRVSPFLLVAGVLAGLAFGFLLGRSDHLPGAVTLRGGLPEPIAGRKEVSRLWTCGMHPQVIQEEPGFCPICGMELTPLEIGAGGKPGSAEPELTAVTIDPVVVQNMGVRVATVSEGPLRATIRAAGFVVEAEPNQHDVNLRVSGWIERLHADTEGMHIERGDPLFDLYSPELQVGVEELIAARRTAAALPGDGDPLARGAGETLVAAARRKLSLWGLGEAEIDRLARLERAPRAVTFSSPIGGHVVEKIVVEGAAVSAGTRVLRIVDHRTLWLDVQVFERHLPFVRLGQEVTAAVQSLLGREFQGEIIFIHPHVEEMTRTTLARIALPNDDLLLRPGMYATAKIEAELTPRALLVPREAVIDTGTRQVAFVPLEHGRFEPRTLKLGAAGDGGLVQVLEGLAPGERVVTSGQFLLDAESRLQEAIQKHLRERLLAPDAGEPSQAGSGVPPAEVPHAH